MGQEPRVPGDDPGRGRTAGLRTRAPALRPDSPTGSTRPLGLNLHLKCLPPPVLYGGLLSQAACECFLQASARSGKWDVEGPFPAGLVGVGGFSSPETENSGGTRGVRELSPRAGKGLRNLFSPAAGRRVLTADPHSEGLPSPAVTG